LKKLWDLLIEKKWCAEKSKKNKKQVFKELWILAKSFEDILVFQ
jgi:hypothetical protein